MKRFIEQHAEQISGTLSGFDRLRFRGTLRWLAYTNGMQWFLNSSGILLKEFKTYVQGVTEQVRGATEQLVKAVGRMLICLNSSRISKEEKARQIAERDEIQDRLVCAFSAVEPCFSYEVHRDAQKRRLELQVRPQKCLHYYFYLQHPEFGFMHLLLQPWFPADAQLLEAVSRPEFLLNGFRSKDLPPILCGETEVSTEEHRRQSAQVSRQLRISS
jgi:hypothetical protein